MKTITEREEFILEMIAKVNDFSDETKQCLLSELDFHAQDVARALFGEDPVNQFVADVAIGFRQRASTMPDDVNINDLRYILNNEALTLSDWEELLK